MTVTVEINEGYCTIAEADEFLPNDAVWLAATDAVKEDAIMWGRYYIDANYYVDLDSWDEIPEPVKFANALMAADLVNGFEILDPANLDILKRKTLKAGSVEKTVEYVAGISNKPPSYEKIAAILLGTLEKRGSNTVFLLRA